MTSQMGNQATDTQMTRVNDTIMTHIQWHHLSLTDRDQNQGPLPHELGHSVGQYNSSIFYYYVKV